MIDCSPDAQMWFKRLFPELKTVAVGANSWNRDRPRSVVSHARRMVKGKFLVSIVNKKWPFEKEKTAQSKFVVSCAYRANSKFNRVRALEQVSGREDLSCSTLTGRFDRVVWPPPSNTISSERRLWIWSVSALSISGKPSVSVDRGSMAYFLGARVNPWEQGVIVLSDV